MIYTPTQLELIRVFGKKELSFGCICKTFLYNGTKEDIALSGIGPLLSVSEKYWTKTEGLIGKDRITIHNLIFPGEWRIDDNSSADGYYELIGHIPHLEDVFRVAEDKNKIRKFEMNVDRNTLGILGLRFYEEADGWSKNRVVELYIPTLPLLEQPKATLIELLTIFK